MAQRWAPREAGEVSSRRRRRVGTHTLAHQGGAGTTSRWSRLCEGGGRGVFGKSPRDWTWVLWWGLGAGGRGFRGPQAASPERPSAPRADVRAPMGSPCVSVLRETDGQASGGSDSGDWIFTIREKDPKNLENGALQPSDLDRNKVRLLPPEWPH